MPFDFKKGYKELYLSDGPAIVDVSSLPRKGTKSKFPAFAATTRYTFPTPEKQNPKN